MFEPLLQSVEGLAEKLRSPEAVMLGEPEPVDTKHLDSYRVFHGRGHCYPGLEFVTADWFSPVLLFTLFKQPEPEWLRSFTEQVDTHPSFNLVNTVLLQHRYEVNAPTQLIKGLKIPQCFALRGHLKFELRLGDQQNAGYFLDMEPGRKWLEARCSGKRVLNLFSYTCAFSVVAEAAGAASVLNVDMSSSALNWGRENHRLNKLPLTGISFLAENILKSWGRIRKGAPYDIVILDPPSFQRGSFVAEKDYAKLVRRLPELLTQGGDILACLNAPELDLAFLQQQFAEFCPQAIFQTRLEPSVDFPDEDPNKTLKLLHFNLQM